MGTMFNVPPIRDAHRNIRIRQLDQIMAIEPIAPYPRSEGIGHPGDEPERPDAVEKRLRENAQRRATGSVPAETSDPRAGGDQRQHGDRHDGIDEYA